MMAEPRASRRRGETKVVRTGGRFISSPVAAIAAGVVTVAVIAIGILFVFFVLNDDAEEETPLVTTPATAAAPDVIPDLTDLGFRVEPGGGGQDPFVPETIDHARQIYAGPEGGEIIVRLYIHPTAEEAEAGFTQLVDAYSNAPLGTVLENPLDAGNPQGPPAFNEADGPAIGDAVQSFVTKQPDRNNRGVTTDVFRHGRLVAVIQVLGDASSDHMDLRSTVANRIIERYSAES
jgi:hypothetical protein